MQQNASTTTSPSPDFAVQVWTLADDANGEPSILSFKVECSLEDVEAGVHYDKACQLAEDAGYENPRAFDEKDPAGRMLVKLANFEATAVQEVIPGDPQSPMWEVPITVDVTMSADVRVRAEDKSEAITLAAQYARDNQQILSVDDALYRGVSDYYCGDPDRLEPLDPLDEGGEAGAVQGAVQGPLGTDDAAPALSSVVKTTLQVTVLHDKAHDLSGMTLRWIADEMDQGDFLGQTRVVRSSGVPVGRLIDEQRALGSDGTFFEDEGSDEEAGGDADVAAAPAPPRP